MIYCDEYDKDCNEVTPEECDNDCCDSCMFCIVYTDDDIFDNPELLESEE